MMRGKKINYSADRRKVYADWRLGITGVWYVMILMTNALKLEDRSFKSTVKGLIIFVVFHACNWVFSH